MKLTGDVATMSKRMMAQTILNDFLRTGHELLHEGDLTAVMEEVNSTRERFNRYGIDIREFLEHGRV